MFKCHCCGETVSHEKRVMVPVVKRKVTYKHLSRKFRSNDTEFVNNTYGWETVKEVPIAGSHLDAFLESNESVYSKEEKEISQVITYRPPVYDTKD